MFVTSFVTAHATTVRHSRTPFDLRATLVGRADRLQRRGALRLLRHSRRCKASTSCNEYHHGKSGPGRGHPRVEDDWERSQSSGPAAQVGMQLGRQTYWKKCHFYVSSFTFFFLSFFHISFIFSCHFLGAGDSDVITFSYLRFSCNASSLNFMW